MELDKHFRSVTVIKYGVMFADDPNVRMIEMEGRFDFCIILCIINVLISHKL